MLQEQQYELRWPFPPPWDPLPPWLKLDEDRLRQVAVLRLDARIQTLRMELGTLEKMKEVIG